MSSIKCKSCGMYYATQYLGMCPRCSRGFGGSISGSSTSTEALGGAEPKKGPGVGMWILLILVLAGIGGLGASAINGSNPGYASDYSYDDTSTDYSSDSSTDLGTDYGTDAGSDSSGTDYSSGTDWIPSGYSAFSINEDVASDDSYDPPSCINDGSGYCWMYKVVSKTYCSTLEATMELTNSGEYIGDAYATIYGLSAGVPQVLEIDAYDNPDVDDSTDGTLVSLICSP